MAPITLFSEFNHSFRHSSPTIYLYPATPFLTSSSHKVTSSQCPLWSHRFAFQTQVRTTYLSWASDGSSSISASVHTLPVHPSYPTDHKSEYPGVRAFSVHPGGVDTHANRTTGIMPPDSDFDTAALLAATFLHLTAGKADWLAGRYAFSSVHGTCCDVRYRYYSANWDISEVEAQWTQRIAENEGLINKLVIPK